MKRSFKSWAQSLRFLQKAQWLALSCVCVLILSFVNCTPGFQVDESFTFGDLESSSVLSKSCFDPSQKPLNKTYILGASEYRSIAEDLFPTVNLTSLNEKLNILPVVPDPFDGNLELKTHEKFILSREFIVEFFASELDRNARAQCDTARKECRVQVVADLIRKIYRRPVPAAEVNRIVSENMDLPFLSFAKLLFYSPEFHFKTQSQTLSPDEFVAKISMGLFGTFPDDELIAAKYLVYESDSALRDQISRLLHEPKNARRFSKRLWKQWLSLQKLEFLELTASDAPKKDQILDSIFQRIETGTLKGESLKDLFYQPGSTPMPVSLLTHPAFAMASSRIVSGQLKSHYVHRGVNIASSLLCLELPPLPAATLEELEASKKKTGNLSHLQAIEQHRSNPRCTSCHSIIDPIGVSLERVDPFGKYRTAFEDGSNILSEGKFLGRDYADLNSMIQIVSESAQIRSCFTKNLKGLLDGDEGRKVSNCDAKEVFGSQPDIPILDAIVRMFASTRFKNREFSIEDKRLRLTEDLIRQMYEKGLGRPADFEGLESWIRIFRASGALAVTQGIFLSPEMESLQLSESDFVERVFQAMAGRAPQPYEQSDLEARLRAIGRAEFLKELIASNAVQPKLAALQEKPK